MFNVVVDLEHVELVSYQLKGVARIFYDQLKNNRAVGPPLLSWAVFENTFLGNFIPRELSEAKVREFLNLKQEG